MTLKRGSFIKRKYLPLLLSSFFAYLFCIVSEFIDTTIGTNMLPHEISKAVGDAIEIVSPVYQIIVFVGGLISIGTATLYEHYLGKYQDKKAHKLFGQSIILSLCVGTFMALLMVGVKNPFLSFFAKGNTLELAKSYYNFYIFIAFLYPQYWLLYYMVHNDADETICFISDGMQLGVHILCSILILKFTDYGIAGLSLGTLLGLIAATITLLFHFLRKNNSIKVSFGFSGRDAIKSIRLGANTSFTYLFVAIVDIAMNKFISVKFPGEGYLLTYSVANLLLNLATVYLNLGESATPFNCVYYSEKNNHGIRKVMKKAHIYALIEGAFFTIVFIAFASYFPYIFSIHPADGAIYEEAKFICYVVSITMIPTAFLFLYISYYPSINKEIYSFILSTLYMLVFPLALAMPLSLIFGFKGISVGLTLVPIFSFLVLFVILIINHQIKTFPLLLKKDKYKVQDYDIKISKQSVNHVNKKAYDFMIDNRVKKGTANNINKLIYEAYKVILLNNKDRKYLCSELDVMVGKHQVIITIRTNGIIFDNVNVANKNYIFTNEYKNIIKETTNKSYLTTTSFNRSTFVFAK